MRRLLASPFLILGVGLGVGVLLMFAFVRQVQKNQETPRWQEPDGRGPWHPMLARLDAFERAGLPETSRWRQAMGSESAAFSYTAQRFGEDNDYRGGRHTGDDLNGIGGENSDFGDPIFSPADGLVVYAGEPSPGWGRVVIVAHRVDGHAVTTLYGHLSEVAVSPGQPVARGGLVGRVGTSRASDFAHLHWEWREGTGLSVVETAYERRPIAEWVQRSPEAEVAARLDPDRVGWPSLAEIQYAADSRAQQRNLQIIIEGCGGRIERPDPSTAELGESGPPLETR